jgi:PAS domain-containing protein
VRADREVRMLHTRGEAVVTEGKVVRLVGSCWDVTEYQTATQALRRTVALLEATLQVTSDGLLVVGADGKVATFNERFTALFGVPAELAAAPDTARLMAWLAAKLEAPGAFAERVRALMADEHSRDVIKLIDGRELEACSAPQRLDGQIAGRVWSFRELKPADA